MFSGILVASVSAQTQKRETVRPELFYLGIQPSITAEQYDANRYTIDINVLPLIAEVSVTDHWSIRINPVAKLQLRPEFPAVFSLFGAGVTVPYHFSKKNSEEGHRGFYAGPNLAMTRHLLDEFNSTTLAAEVGYSYIFNRVYSVTVGAQAGRTMAVAPDTGHRTIMNHSSAIFSFGVWF